MGAALIKNPITYCSKIYFIRTRQTASLSVRSRFLAFTPIPDRLRFPAAPLSCHLVTIQDLLLSSRLHTQSIPILEYPILTHSSENPEDELKRLREWVAAQTALIELLRERIRELEARRAKDSHNSSRPPSSGSPFRKPPPCSQRQPSGRKPGGQPGRHGATRSLVDHPDQCVIIPLTGTCACGRYGTGIAATVLAERRQVVEVEIQRKVIEYRIVGGTCACGRAQRSMFPAGIEAPAQYGPGVSRLCGLHDPIPVVALPAHCRGAQ